ncbi:MAG: HAMP domain-containing protein [Nitrospirae bacterium]|nr:HAMP domain-containing protein [Nitrospirota bacterium]
MKKRLVLSLFLLFLLFSAGAGMSVLYINKTTSDLDSLIKLHRVEIIRQDLVINVHTVQTHLYTIETEFGKELDVIVENVTDLDNSVQSCIGCHHGKEISAKIEDIRNLVEQYKEALSYFITTTANPERVKRLQMVGAEIGNSLLSKTQEMAFIANRRLNDRTIKAMKDIKNSEIILFITIILAFFIALPIAVVLTRGITKPISELVSATRKVKTGELGYTSAYKGKDEFGELISAFNEMSISLKESNDRILQQMQELKDAQEQLIQTAKLAALGEIASNIAHELNNPLTCILGYAGLIKEEKEIDSIMRNTEVIIKESMRARDIVRQLLEFSRKRPLEIKRVDLNETIKDIVRFVSVQLKNANITTIENYGEIPHISGDENQLKQVFLNVINNAIFAMPKGGNITINTDVKDGQVYIDISDTGIGIPEEIMHRIFEPFFTTKQERGTGLGLSISYRIIQSHGGRINVESEEGKGTRFIITFPVTLKSVS